MKTNWRCDHSIAKLKPRFPPWHFPHSCTKPSVALGDEKSAKLKKCTKLTAATFEAITAAKSSQTITLTTRDCLVSIKTEWYASSIQGKSREPWRGRLAQSPGIPGQIAQFVSLICKFRISRRRIHSEGGRCAIKWQTSFEEKKVFLGAGKQRGIDAEEGKSCQNVEMSKNSVLKRCEMTPTDLWKVVKNRFFPLRNTDFRTILTLSCFSNFRKAFLFINNACSSIISFKPMAFIFPWEKEPLQWPQKTKVEFFPCSQRYWGPHKEDEAQWGCWDR